VRLVPAKKQQPQQQQQQQQQQQTKNPLVRGNPFFLNLHSLAGEKQQRQQPCSLRMCYFLFRQCFVILAW
jgi:hypothetical protein